MKKPTLDIALNLDDKYIVQAIVMLTSIFVNNRDIKTSIHVITRGLSERSCRLLEQCVTAKYGQGLHLYIIGKPESDIFPHYTSGHISDAANYRLLAAEVLPPSVHRILYLDCDLIVEASLLPLAKADISHYAVGAVEDTWSGKAEKYRILGYRRRYGYFNSGVLLINLDWWREHKLTEAFVHFADRHNGLKYVDQDILNGLLYTSWKPLSMRWNIQDGFLRCRPKIREEKKQEMLSECQSPAIIHYAGRRKPWNYDSQNPLNGRYYHYLDMTQWRGMRPSVPFGYRCKQIADNILTVLHLKARKYRQGLRCPE